MLPIRFLPYSVYMNTSTDVMAWINQIESTSPEGGVTLFEESSGSEVDRQFVAAKEIAPIVPINTSDLTILDTIGLDGVFTSADNTDSPGFTVYGRELPLGAVPTAIGTADHLKLEINNGLIVPVGLRAGHNTVAKLNLMLHAFKGEDGEGGDIVPFIWSAESTITSGSVPTSLIFGAGPIKFGDRLVQGIGDINVNFGIEVFKEGDSSDVYQSHVSIISRMSKIEFTTKDVELVTEVGNGVSISSLAAYFRKVDQNGQRVDPSTTDHVSIAGTAGMLTPGSTTLTYKRPGESAFTFTPSLNSTLLTISTSAAIPTS